MPQLNLEDEDVGYLELICLTEIARNETAPLISSKSRIAIQRRILSSLRAISNKTK